MANQDQYGIPNQAEPTGIAEAIWAALEDHSLPKPVYNAFARILSSHPEDEGDFGTIRVCKNCEDVRTMPGGYWPVSSYYPCKTIRDIADALGIEYR